MFSGPISPVFESPSLISQLTYADLAIYHLFSHMVSDYDDRALAQFPHLAVLHQSVENLPNIARWLQERPQDLI